MVQESAIFMGLGIMKLNSMIPNNDYRIGIGKKLKKNKKAKRKQVKQSRKANR